MTGQPRDDWVPKYRAELWWCGDEVCDCCQPQITLMTPNVTVGRPWYRLTRLWEGAFHSEPSSDELAAMRSELLAECARRGIPEGVSLADVSWDEVRRVDREQMAAAGLSRGATGEADA